MRKLASVKTVADIQPIPGKDRIALATIDGWHVVVRKDEFKVGDSCVYVEIDSVLPEKPEFEFLRGSKFRVKTAKIGGAISQGVCFPMTILPSGVYQPDQDVTDIIGVRQYEITLDSDPAPSAPPPQKKYPKFLMRMKWFRRLVLPKKADGEFPSFVSKTDETRIQNIPFILDSNEHWVATEKIDGQSGTFALVRHKSKIPLVPDKFEFIVCSRNRRLPVPDQSSYWRVAEKFHIRDALRQMIGGRSWIAIQGEIIGPKIQGNKYKVSDYDLFVFNVIYPEGRQDSLYARSVVGLHGLKFVPIIDSRVRLPKTVDEVLEYAHGKSQLCDIYREGIVFRSRDGQKSFKAVDPLFLMQYDE